MSGHIGVGIIGANPDRGWASRAHIPAVHASPDFTLTAVATTRRDTAEAARDRFGARHAFTDPVSLSRHPDVDLVVVTVKVPSHAELVSAALDAGKDVYCEWPLARGAAEADALATAAERAAVRTVVGLQARFGPAAARARRMIDDGALGTVLSATLYSSRSKGITREVPAWTAYTYDANSGAGLVEVVGGHGIDLVRHLLGPIRNLTARTAIRSGDHVIAETGEPVSVTAADHLLATAELESGAVVSIHLHEAESSLPRTRLEIAGTAGNLALVSAPETDPWAAQSQIAHLELRESRPGDGTWRPVPLAGDAAAHLPIQSANVFRLYQNLATDLHTGTNHTPTFRAAHTLHVLLDDIPRPPR